MPSSFAPDRIEFNTANDVLGALVHVAHQHEPARGQALVLRCQRSSLTETRGQRPWLLSAPVQTDKTVESIQELRRELADFVAAKPVTDRRGHQGPQPRRARAVRTVRNQCRREPAPSANWCDSTGPTIRCRR